MEVEVKLFATFRKDRFKSKTMSLAGDDSLGQLLEQLAIVYEEVGILLVNGNGSDVNQKLSQGDVVSIFPLIGGG